MTGDNEGTTPVVFPLKILLFRKYSSKLAEVNALNVGFVSEKNVPAAEWKAGRARA